MQILIDIPEETYNAINKHGIIGEREQYEDVIIGIQGGTPLPEYHGRLIDASALLMDFSFAYNKSAGECVHDAPTIIPATEEKSCENCAHKDDDFDCHNFCVPYDFDHYIPATKEGDGE